MKRMMMKAFKQVIFVGCLLMTQAACTETNTVNALHVHYTSQDDSSYLLKSTRRTCNEYHALGIYEKPFTIYGDKSLLGHGVVDEYWSRKGDHHVAYKMSYIAEPVEPCVFRVAPEVKVEYQNFIMHKKITYKQVFKDQDAAPGGRWGALDEVKQGESPSGSIEESLGVKDLPADTAENQKIAKLLMGMFTGTPEPVGKEKVAGKNCELMVALSKWDKGGVSNYACGWDPKDPNLPDRIVLKKYIKWNEGTEVAIGGETVADTVNDNVAVPLSLLTPLADWHDKPAGTYLTREGASGEWASAKQQAQPKETNNTELEKQMKRRLEAQMKERFEAEMKEYNLQVKGR